MANNAKPPASSTTLRLHQKIMRGLGLCGLLASGAVVGCGDTQPKLFSDRPSCPSGSQQIQAQVLAPNCGNSGCHSASNPALGLDLVSPNLEARLVNVPASGCGEQTLVVAGNAAHSYLFTKLTQDAPPCGDRMPLGAAPLSSAQVECLQTWVNGLVPTGTSTGGQSSTGGQPGMGATNAGGMSAGGSNAGMDSNGGAGGRPGTGVVGGSVNSGGGSSTTGGASATTGGTTNSAGGTTNSAGGSMSTGGTVSSSGGALSSGGQPSCPSTVLFASQVQPIFTSSCASVGCHTGARPAEGLTLASGSSYAALVNVAASECASHVRVKPSNVSESYLMDKLLATKLCSGSQMPKAGSSLPSAELAAIRCWISQGAIDN